MPSFDSFNKAPGVYVQEEIQEVPSVSGVSPSIGAMLGVSAWGPVGVPVAVENLGQFIEVFGKLESDIYPSFKQAKKFFMNGGGVLYFTRVVHFSDITDPLSKTSSKAIGYLVDGTATPASISAVTPKVTNTSDPADILTATGTYTGASNGTYRIKVTTGGAFATAKITAYFTAEFGVEATIGEFTPVSATPLTINNGISVTLTDGGTDGLSLNDEWSFTVQAAGTGEADRRIIVNALYDGTMGHRISVTTEDGGNGIAGEFKLNVLLDGVLAEMPYDNLSLDVDATNYFVNKINGVSKYITVEDTDNVQDIKIGQDVTLAGADDGLVGLVKEDYLGDEESQTGLEALLTVELPLLVYCPDADIIGGGSIFDATSSLAVKKGILNFIEMRHKLSFTPVIVPYGTTPEETLTFMTSTFAMDKTRYAMYKFWLRDEDDGKMISPIGAIMGMYSRIAQNFGVWVTPGGDRATLLGFTGVEGQVSASWAGKFNQNRINLIKVLPDVGIVCYGGRTGTITQLDFKYIGARLNTSNIEYLIAKSTQFAPLRPNTQALWGQISTIVKNICGVRLRDGGLEDYFVVCDSSNNNQNTKTAGIVNCKVGLFNLSTAEFIVFTVSQMASGALVAEG